MLEKLFFSSSEEDITQPLEPWTLSEGFLKNTTNQLQEFVTILQGG